jgi:predicted RNA methylase
MSQTTGLKRNTIDKYYTSPTIVNQCITFISQNIPIDKQDLCIEPSAGNGAFIDGIKTIFTHHRFYDIDPHHTEIVPLDYLQMDETTLNADQYRKIHCIGNPPFGRQSSLAIKFIKKSASYCDSISFILPKSFKKDSLRKHFPLAFHLEYEYDIPDNSFLVDNATYNVPCVFQIWIKKDILRELPEKLVPTYYRFVEKENSPDISARRVGVYAGQIDKQTEYKSSQSHYFIKFDKCISETLMEKISTIEYPCKNNTVGPRSISKQELIREFNKILI